jgi:uncharacterized protein YggE
MRTTYIILGLATLTAVIGLYMTTSNPEQAGELARVQREIAFSGEGREAALLALGLGLAAFIGYLTLTRR